MHWIKVVADLNTPGKKRKNKERDNIVNVSGGNDLFLFRKRNILLTNAFLDADKVKTPVLIDKMDIFPPILLT